MIGAWLVPVRDCLAWPSCSLDLIAYLMAVAAFAVAVYLLVCIFRG